MPKSPAKPSSPSSTPAQPHEAQASPVATTSVSKTTRTTSRAIAKTVTKTTSSANVSPRVLQEAIENIVRTPQELVHIRHSITLVQYKLWILMLRAFRQRVEEEGDAALNEDMCYVSMKTLAQYIGYEPKTSLVRQDLEAIRKEPIIFNLLSKDGKESQIGQGFISMWHVTSARVGVVLPPVIRHAVRNMDSRASIFHNLNWAVFNSMGGKYEAIIYKLCKDYVGVGRTPYMDLATFRKYVGLQETEYPDFKQLSQWVISRPMKRVNANPMTDIEVGCEYRKQGRRVVGLQFMVTPKLQSVMDFGDDPAFRFARVAVSLSQQQKYLKDHGAESVEMSIKRANEYGQEQEKAGREVNYGALYRRAIEEEWGREHQSRLQQERERAEEEGRQRQQAMRDAQRKKLQAALEDLHNEYMLVAKMRAIDALDADQVAQLAARYADGSADGSRVEFDAASGRFVERVTNSLFRLWLKSEVKVAFDQDAFHRWLEEDKGIDPADLEG